MFILPHHFGKTGYPYTRKDSSTNLNFLCQITQNLSPVSLQHQNQLNQTQHQIQVSLPYRWRPLRNPKGIKCIRVSSWRKQLKNRYWVGLLEDEKLMEWGICHHPLLVPHTRAFAKYLPPVQKRQRSKSHK